MTLVIVNFFNDSLHVVDKGALLITEVAQVTSCMPSSNLLIFDLAHVCFVKLF